ncbi:MAG TPA: helix-turn-helix transcriptional regulator [Candidatus Sulfomarinibacteraceae bacterium]|nr:helix-turn-helix transcriptional regulator [Candidatus Sulfomarinibacteraceae bacterium]
MPGFLCPTFTASLRATLGENIADYVRRVRMERAARTLRMGAVDIPEVALAAEYATHAAFSTPFKQQFGLSPSEFRQLDCWTATLILREGG